MSSPQIQIQNGQVISSQCKDHTEYGDLDVTKFFNTKYNYQLIDENVLDYDFFHFNAKDFTNDIHIGFSNGFNGHNDKKWEIVLGAWEGKQHVIRDQNQKPLQGLTTIKNNDRTQFDDLKKDFIVEVQDNYIR